MCFPQGYLQAEISYKEKHCKLEKDFSKENCKNARISKTGFPLHTCE